MVFVTMVNICMVNRLIFLGSHFCKVDRLDLVTIGQVGVVSRLDHIIMIICLSGCELMLSSCFKVMRSLAMMFSGL